MKFAGASLVGARMHKTMLTDADLSGANLSGAEISWSMVMKVNLAGAEIGRASCRERVSSPV